MTKQANIGARVSRRRDGALGTIVERVLSVSDIPHPGIFGKTLVSVRLDDETLRASAGGDMQGDLGWLRSYFRIL